MDAVTAALLHKYVYPGVPPPAVTLAVPFDPPKQLVGVALHVAETADAGSVTSEVHVAVHPLLSVTVTVYIPADNPLIDAVTAVLLHK